MAKKPNAPVESAPPAVDPQQQYLMDQFGGLMDQVGDGFGGPLQEELIRRLEQTIADFHEEVSEMLGNLKDNSEKTKGSAPNAGIKSQEIKVSKKAC